MVIKLLSGNLNGKDLLGDLGIDQRISKWIVGKHGMNLMTGFGWQRAGICE
jgi:hypothetical protein